MSHKAIIDLNEQLIRCHSNYDIIEYINRVNDLNNKPMDLSFMEELISFVDKDTCCIPHDLLVKYGVFKGRNASANVKSRLLEYDFIENEDFKFLEVQEFKKGRNKSVYLLHPEAFKLILMRSKCDKKYAKYYLFLEKCIKYYHEYQIRYKEYMLSQKDDKIDELSKKIDDQSKEIQELLQYSKSAQEKLDNIEDELITTSTNLEMTMTDLSIVQDKLDIAVEDRAVKPKTDNKINQLAILKNIHKDSLYYIACGQKRYIERTISLKIDSYDIIELIDKVPNSIYLFDHIKKYFGKQVTSSNRSISLLTISESDFIDNIRSLFDGRKDIDLSKKP